MGDIFDDIRREAAAVTAEARFVRLNRRRLATFAGELETALLAPAEIDPRYHWIRDPESTAAYFVTLDTINFGSGWFPHLAKVERLSGYFTVALRLKEEFESRGGPWSARLLAQMNTDECVRVFRQEDADAEARELMALFAGALRELGRHLAQEHEGSASTMIRAANRSAANLVHDLRRMTFYDDTAEYRGRRVPFYKRAQLLAADLALVFKGDGLGRFDDLDRLTIFADNLVPHVLRMVGVMELDPDLSARIENGILIRPGSEEEIEMRAVAIQAVEEIVSVLTARGHKTTAARVDYWLWNRGQSPEMKARPRHRARTTFY